jgi:ketosteroid isomerase-like protein
MQQVRTTIERFWQAHSTGNHEALKQVLDKDFTWTVVGRNCPIAKTYHGWDGFLGELLGGLATGFNGTMKMELRGIYADEKQGVGVLHLIDSATAAPTGFEMQLEIADIIKVRDGKIVEVREIMDLVEVVRAFGFPL